MTSIPTEQEIRSLRDTVFGRPSSDENWSGCRENWMRPASVKWLQDTIAHDPRNKSKKPVDMP